METQDEQSNPQQNDNDSQKDMSGGVPCSEGKNTQTSAEKCCKNKKKSWWKEPNNYIAIANVILAIIAIIAVCYTIRQINSSDTYARRTIDIANSNMRIDNRAWIAPSAFSRTTMEIEPNTIIRVKIQNFGKTPPTEFKATLTFHVDTSNDIYTLPHDTLGEFGYIAPTDSLIFKEEVDKVIPTFDGRYANAIRNNKLWFYMDIFMIYKDIFGGLDTTESCNIWDVSKQNFIVFKRLNRMK